ncbi:MAG: hypothetical protein ACI8VT_004265 [Saprospiraceae bacterium]|jgi:hypothetical protein
MLGLVLIYFIGKYFYELAQRFDKNGWGYAILGVASYYIGSFIGGIILVLCYEFLAVGSIDGINDFALGLIALPFGLLACWGTYKLLERNFSNAPTDTLHPDILDDEFLDSNIKG